MNARHLLAVLLTAVTAAAVGCNGDKKNVSSSDEANQEPAPVELVAMARPPIPDLPVPIGFDLDQDRSRNLAAAGIRWVDHLYKGNANKFAVARFYRKHMPISRWTLVTEMFSTGRLKLDFERQSDRCHVTISNGDLFHKTFIKIELWTAGRVPEPPAPKTAPKRETESEEK